MSRKIPKFLKGNAVISLHEVVVALEAGRYLFFRGKPLHPSFYGAWQLHHIQNTIKWGNLHIAMENPAWWEKEFNRVSNYQIKGRRG